MRIYENISLTERAAIELNKYAGFSLTNLESGDGTIVFLQWIILSRRLHKGMKEFLIVDPISKSERFKLEKLVSLEIYACSA